VRNHRSLFAVVLVALSFLSLPSSAQQRTVSNGVQFAPPIVLHYPGSYPQAISSGDFNNDGIADLIAGAQFGGVNVKLSRGDGSFGHWHEASSPSNYVGAIAAGKFDGKNLDAVINDDTDAWVLLGDGKGGLPSYTFLDAGSNFVVSFAVGDFNGDGKPDIAALAVIVGQTTESSEVYLYLGNGDGTFQSPRQLSVSPLGPVAILAGDFNGDGKLDLAVLSYSFPKNIGRASVLLGDGKGGFGHPIVFHLHGLFNFPSMTSGDFNQDKKLDLAVATSNYNPNKNGFVRILLGNGDGTFHEGAHTRAGLPNPLSITSADFNGDGIPDLVMANSACHAKNGDFNCISILLGNGDGTFERPANFRAGGETALQLTVADFNGDGKPDVATVNVNSQNVSVLLNTTPFPAPKTKPARSQQH
jgi:FG-GAP-like repeat/FG-GAP repeat